MNQDLILKYQAYVDGELPEAEARKLAEAIAADAAASALVEELRQTKAMLAGNEPQVALPETREFHWSKIQREIERLEREPVRTSGGWLDAWRRVLAPLSGVAVVVCLAIGILKFYDNGSLPDLTPDLAEIENLSEHSTSFSFRSDNMFVVWVQDAESQSNDEEIEFIDN